MKKKNKNLPLLLFLRMQRQAASPIITAVTPPQTAIITIANVDSLFVSMLPGSWHLLPGTLKGFGTFCDVVADAVLDLNMLLNVCVVAGEGLISIVVDSIELVENSTLGDSRVDFRFVDPVGTKE